MTDRDKTNVGDIARAWWHQINGTYTKKPRDRGAFAELRRNADPLDLVFVATFRGLQNGLRAYDDRTLRRAAMIAHVLAHVREDGEIRFARALGPPRGDEKAAMSETRFGRLLQARDDADLTRRLVRAVKMLKGKANVADLAWAIWFWNDRARQRWMFDYFAAEPPADRTAA